MRGGLFPVVQTQPRSCRGRSKAKVLGPCCGHRGCSGSCCRSGWSGVRVVLQRRHVHSGLHSCSCCWKWGAQCICLSGSSRHASSVLGAGGVNKKDSMAAKWQHVGRWSWGLLGLIWWNGCRFVCGQLGLGSAHRVAGIACGALFPRQGSMVVGMLGMLVGGCAPGGLQRNLHGGHDGTGAMKTQVLSPAHLGWCPGKWCSWPRQLVPVGSHFGFHLLPGRGWLGRCGQQVCWP